MSLVGPRPAVPDEVAKYADHVRRRLMVKPGLTGLWQVNGRSDLSWDESVRLDLRYVENWSFALDLQILWKTISALYRGRGLINGSAHSPCADHARRISQSYFSISLSRNIGLPSRIRDRSGRRARPYMRRIW